MEEIIRPALAKRIWVVCDRFFDATIVYQGYVRGQDMDLIRTLNREACGGMEPDMTFLLDCPVEIGLERARARNRRLSQEGQDRFEREKRQFHESVRAGYLSLAASHPDRFVVLDATLREAKLEAEIVDHIRPFLWKQGNHG
jgi:dTMP kinase